MDFGGEGVRHTSDSCPPAVFLFSRKYAYLKRFYAISHLLGHHDGDRTALHRPLQQAQHSRLMRSTRLSAARRFDRQSAYTQVTAELSRYERSCQHKCERLTSPRPPKAIFNVNKQNQRSPHPTRSARYAYDRHPRRRSRPYRHKANRDR